MPLEIKLLLWSVALTAVQAVTATLGTTAAIGLPKALGNREGLPAIEGWSGRAIRAHRNMLENIVLFGILVLVAQALGKFNAVTLLGAQLFFWARLAYAPIYIVGIPVLRTLVFVTSIVGLVMIFFQLVPLR